MAKPLSYECSECGETFTGVDEVIDRACTRSNGTINMSIMFCEKCSKRLLAEIMGIK